MSIYKILSFDPGLSTLGYADSTYNTDNEILVVNRFGTFKPTKSALKEKDQSATYGHRLIALNLLEDEVQRLIDLYKPDYIASEDVFLHMKHINAFAALTLCLHTLKKAAFTKQKTIYTMTPCDIKKSVADSGHADKDAIQKAILNHKYIKIENVKSTNISKMCEHEADAIAVGYTFASCILPNLIISSKLATASNLEDLQVEEEKPIKVKRKRRMSLQDPIEEIPVILNKRKHI